MKTIIPYGRQNINQDDINAIIEVLKSDFLTQGPVVGNFENAICEYCNVKYGVATNSATGALHIACLALNVGAGDHVWTSPITFVASANCAVYCGAKIDFVDIDPKTYNISVSKLAEKLVNAKKNNCLPKVLIPVHFSGQPCDMEAIFQLSLEYGFKIIEDASHAIGAKYKGVPVGSCTYSDITVFSFHPVKIITTGEGGMAVTNNIQLYAQMQRLRSHGITRDPSEMTHAPDGPWYYQQLDLGYNYRMSDIHAALGLSQIKRLDEFIERRHKIAKLYNELLEDSNFQIPYQANDSFSSFHLYVIRVNNSKLKNRKEIFERLRSNGILVNLHYIPVYHHPYYRQFSIDLSKLDDAESYYEEAISLPIYFGLTDDEVRMIVNTLQTPLNYQTIF
jgi:UDP-4-amino-4,6-dideoxy-N-acetyl-beta-L-altrosamine transaminase